MMRRATTPSSSALLSRIALGATLAPRNHAPMPVSPTHASSLMLGSGMTISVRAMATSSFTTPKNTNTASLGTSKKYKTTLDFEPVVMKYFNDGFDSEFKDELRVVLSNGESFKPRPYSNWSPEKEHLVNVERVKEFLAAGKVSVAHLRSTPRKFLSMYEVAATFNGSLALSLATHYSLAANIAAGVGSTAYHHQAILSDVDSGKVLCASAVKELFAEEPPFATVAKFDTYAKSWILDSGPEGSGVKFNVVNGQTAQWAIVSAKPHVSNTMHSPQLFLVQLRNAQGKMLDGITMKPIGRTGSVDGLGATAVHFSKVSIPEDALIKSTHELTTGGSSFDPLPEPKADEKPRPTGALVPLMTSQRLAFSAIALGRTKRMLHDLTNFMATRQVLGPFGEYDHPMFGLQHAQTRVTSYLTDLYVLNAAYHQVTTIFCDPLVQPTSENFVQLAIVNARLVELMTKVGEEGQRLAGTHATLSNAGFTESIALAASMREGPEDTHLSRVVALEAALNNYSSIGVAAYIRNKLSFGSARRFLANPFFSPTSSELGRYVILFGEREFFVRSSVTKALSVARRSGPEATFYAWSTEEHRSALHLERVYGDKFLLQCVMNAVQDCKDQYNRRVLRDIGWQWALKKIDEDATFMIKEQLFGPRQLGRLHTQLDNLSSNIAHQSMHLIQAFGIPLALAQKTSPLAGEWDTPYALGPKQETDGEGRVREVQESPEGGGAGTFADPGAGRSTGA